LIADVVQKLLCCLLAFVSLEALLEATPPRLDTSSTTNQEQAIGLYLTMKGSSQASRN
jgi:hypothetical protein